MERGRERERDLTRGKYGGNQRGGDDRRCGRVKKILSPRQLIDWPQIN
jgi:hypothetical protein